MEGMGRGRGAGGVGSRASMDMTAGSVDTVVCFEIFASNARGHGRSIPFFVWLSGKSCYALVVLVACP